MGFRKSDGSPGTRGSQRDWGSVCCLQRPSLWLCPPGLAPYLWLLPSQTQPTVWEPGTKPPGRGGLKVSGHEQFPDGDWQAPGPAARTMAVPQAARRLSGCHPRAKERRRHRIKGQRTSGAGGGRAAPASTPAAKSLAQGAARRALCRRRREDAAAVARRPGASRVRPAAGPPDAAGGDAVALPGSRPARRSRGIQVRGLEGIRWVQGPGPRGGSPSPRLDLRLCTCQTGSNPCPAAGVNSCSCVPVLAQLPGEGGSLRFENPGVHPARSSRSTG